MKNFKMLSLALATFFTVSAFSLVAKENPRGIRKGYEAKFQQWAEENPKAAKQFNSLAKKHPEAAKWFYSEARKNPEVSNQLYKEAKKNPLLAKSVYENSRRNSAYKYNKAKRENQEGRKHPRRFKQYDKSKRDHIIQSRERFKGERLKKDNRKEGRPHFKKEDRQSEEGKE